MSNPYKFFPKTSYWRPSVGDKNMLEIRDLWTAKIAISRDDTFATAGSCFAQHISRALANSGFHWVDAEPAPDTLPKELKSSFGYGVFSFRTGNIYTAAMLRQWVEGAFGKMFPDEELWEENGRFYDPLRPSIEPEGFMSREELISLRTETLRAMRETLSSIDVLVFTLGLTECWRNKKTGLVYAFCPGTLAGDFSQQEHEFHNLNYSEIMEHMTATFDCIKEHNPKVRFLLTVSPVPLIATAMPDHVLVTTSYSKAVLRAVAGDLKMSRPDTDYFPSFEIINSPPFRGSFFMPNQREVSATGVKFVMQHFFAGIGLEPDMSPIIQHDVGNVPSDMAASQTYDSEIDIQCEEALLEAFTE